MKIKETAETKLSEIWSEQHGSKGDLLDRCEQYARWTVASAFPKSEDEKSDTPEETDKGNVAIGARLVNHLAHRVVDTMFPNDRPFFAVTMTPDAKRKFDADAGDEEKVAVKDAVANAENAAMREMNLTAYRPIAVEAMILKIVTGNALIHRMSDGSRAVYSIRDYCATRQINGKVMTTILRDMKKFRSLSPEVQAKVKEINPSIEDTDNVEMYTYYYRNGGKWYMRQAVDDVELDIGDKSYNDKDFPCLVLTWSLHRGDNYGRGLVEDYAVSFHNIDVMTAAMIDMVGIAADIKFLVNDSSAFDIDAWNRAKRGEYVPGKEGDITSPEFKFAMEIQVIVESIAKLERELSQAFLLSSAGVRDAERVTAEEIRFFAREIESAFGGLYSRLALEWQRREAEYALSQINFADFFEDGKSVFEAVVVTGLESLSREGKIDSMRLAFSDLQMLDTVPEEMRQTINPLKFMAFVFRQRSVNPDDFLFTADEMEKNRAAAKAEEAEMVAQQGEAQVAAKAVS